ncbi:Hypothetical protein LUCI_4415 [Lucifera butyrica]|uniref:Uncharacterized protein n=1 Tax=Lucifera butyrica TaxID=1351585 RepID=A0A498RCW7_9FIRM|nr:HD domain-containing protein [Lucifera butyrica]VBB09129.1 Hypothetical protein LUCI_4415 [Lucifera butyrica]
MKTKMIAVKELVPDMIIGDAVLAPSGKVLLGKNVRVTPRTISLLSMWDVNFVYILDSGGTEADNANVSEDISQPDQQPEQEPNLSVVFRTFYNEYNTIVSGSSQSFDFVRNYKQVPIQELKDLSFSIYSTVLSTGAAAMDYLLVSDYNLADQVSRHSVMVAFISSMIGRQMRFEEKDIQSLVLAGLLHDIGKFVISKEEETAPAAHIISGAKLLRNVTGVSPEVVAAILYHHECLDGSGFPMAKQGDKVPVYARVIAIADTFHKEAYRMEYSNPFCALEYIFRERFTKFDPLISQVFINNVRDALLNSSVMLSDGRIAKVIFFNEERYGSPVVRTENGKVIDLAATKNLTIHYVLNEEYLVKVN